MALCPGDTTQWDDIQRKLGNFAPKEREIPQRDIEKAVVEAIEKIDPFELCNLKELDQLEDDVEEDTLASYRRQRLAELKAAQKASKFGEVLQVARCDFVAQVTEGSANGQWVLVFLYVDSSTACQQFSRPWVEAARRFPAVKFMRGVATEVIADFPDSSTPAVLVYRDGDCKKQLIGLDKWGGRRCSTECVEWVLSELGIVSTELEEDPRRGATTDWARPARRSSVRHEGSSEEEDEDGRDDRCFTSSRLGHTMFGRA